MNDWCEAHLLSLHQGWTVHDFKLKLCRAHHKVCQSEKICTLLLGRFPLPRVVVLVWLPTSPTAARLACNHLRFMAGLLLPCLEIQIFYSFIIWSSECPAHLGKIPKMSLIKSITLISKCLLDVDCHLCLDCFFFLVWLLRQAELRTASGAIAVTAVLNIRRGRREGGS